MGPRYSRTEDDSASSHSGDKSRRISLKGMAANVAHKDAWQRRHQGTRSVEGATVVDQDFVEDPIALGPGGDIAVACPPVRSHPTPEYAWEGVELAQSSTNTIEHLSFPYDPASRRLCGVPIVATVSEAAGVGHVLAVDAVVVDTDTIGVGVQWSETSNTDDFAKNLILLPLRLTTAWIIGTRPGTTPSPLRSGSASTLAHRPPTSVTTIRFMSCLGQPIPLSQRRFRHD